MKFIKRVSVLFMTLMFMLSLSTTVFAANMGENTVPDGIVLSTGNAVTEKTEDGWVTSVELLQEVIEESQDGVSTQAIGWKVVGIAKFRLRPHTDNLYADADWSVALDNGDVIKSVTGYLYLKKDIFGPINPEYDSKFVSQDNKGTLFSDAYGSEILDLIDKDFDLGPNTGLIYQWRDFVVKGVEGTYYVKNGEQQGKVKDFSSAY